MLQLDLEKRLGDSERFYHYYAGRIKETIDKFKDAEIRQEQLLTDSIAPQTSVSVYNIAIDKTEAEMAALIDALAYFREQQHMMRKRISQPDVS